MTDGAPSVSEIAAGLIECRTRCRQIVGAAERNGTGVPRSRYAGHGSVTGEHVELATAFLRLCKAIEDSWGPRDAAETLTATAILDGVFRC